jgi:hypothetical protein
MFGSNPMWVVRAALACVYLQGVPARACDDLADKLLSSFLGPAIKGLGCSELGKAGVDKADHKLESVCYTSSGPTSSVEIVASLHCHTGDQALIPVSISERVTADAQVRGADCSVQNVSVRPSGEIGKVLASALNANGRARNALQEGLNKLCAGAK